MIHTMKLQPNYYNYIKNGTKRFEIRLLDEKRKLIKINDIIEFSKEPINEEKFRTKVINLFHYNTFEEMCNDIDIELLADKSISKEDLIKELEKYYPKEKQLKYKIIAIQIELID